jgi:hypothetical protein
MTSSELSSTSNQYDNSSSLLSSAVTQMVQRPTSDRVGQPLVYIPTSVYDSLICKEEGLHSGSLTSVGALVNTVEPSNQTRVAGNVSTLSSSQQLLTFSNVSKAPSGSQFLGSILTSKQRKSLESVESASNMGTQLESSSSTSNEVMTQSRLSDTSNQYANFSSSLNTVVPVMVQQPALGIMKWPLQESSVAEILSPDKRGLRGPPNALISAPNCVVVPRQQQMVSVLSPHAKKRKQQLYIRNGSQESTSLGGNQQAVIFEGQRSHARYDMKSLYW